MFWKPSMISATWNRRSISIQTNAASPTRSGGDHACPAAAPPMAMPPCATAWPAAMPARASSLYRVDQIQRAGDHLQTTGAETDRRGSTWRKPSDLLSDFSAVTSKLRPNCSPSLAQYSNSDFARSSAYRNPMVVVLPKTDPACEVKDAMVVAAWINPRFFAPSNCRCSDHALLQ